MLLRVRICRCAAVAAQNLVIKGHAQEVIDAINKAIIGTKANELSFTNLRYHMAKYFGYVLPTKKLIDWMYEKFKGCKCVFNKFTFTCLLYDLFVPNVIV